MGMDQRIAFAQAPTWALIAGECAKRQCPLQLRMIDGELAFPDETPNDGWRELRVSTSAGMITLKREADGITLVTWGNADENLRRDWNTIAAALHEISQERCTGK